MLHWLLFKLFFILQCAGILTLQDFTGVMKEHKLHLFQLFKYFYFFSQILPLNSPDQNEPAKPPSEPDESASAIPHSSSGNNNMTQGKASPPQAQAHPSVSICHYFSLAITCWNYY